jgi:RNA polymerase sigma-70 factor (ECF subfamily)
MDEKGSQHGNQFLTTRWSVVLQARHPDPVQASAALEALCRAYWFPLYAHARRQGLNPTDAQDMTQAFFARLLERRTFDLADRERGRFRSFLLASMRHFMADEHDRVTAWKRGGRVEHVPLDPTGAEHQLESDQPVTGADERRYDRDWARSVMDRVKNRLREEADRVGRRALFDALHPEPGTDPDPYEVIAGRLGMTEGAVKLAAFRVRQRYRELIREEVAETVADPSEIDDEIRHLMHVLAGTG